MRARSCARRRAGARARAQSALRRQMFVPNLSHVLGLLVRLPRCKVSQVCKVASSWPDLLLPNLSHVPWPDARSRLEPRAGTSGSAAWTCSTRCRPLGRCPLTGCGAAPATAAPIARRCRPAQGQPPHRPRHRAHRRRQAQAPLYRRAPAWLHIGTHCSAWSTVNCAPTCDNDRTS